MLNPYQYTVDAAYKTHFGTSKKRLNLISVSLISGVHCTSVHQILPQNLPARLQFTHFLQNMQTENPDFLKTILFTDKATFTRRNNHLWDSENPHPVKERHFQREFKVNICCGVISTFVIGPFELDFYARRSATTFCLASMPIFA
ncbi:hypothetical protein NQ318_008669 [Aromia moschata]|uniref:Transposase n=1 Tax=Aromia moschata TaxID=1265417 RepID=A0AAV8XKL0_9CUCU|nr:hypothetical protein NQ318_008669 [Aromia moschata]